ncbi:hypothetical protein Athai_00780 [Actinocatenispora thailandica]|uniref:3-octaprenyl-4-hydroxybenzoate carboxy-lyase-like N-terminal domain-containing protein n=1 Tax=Actinocatenispora thailandica TaxID=227318 RepID=A0A7R7DJ13_9ACTN|nr:hypothetical protein Athai_00780 [Actinocatenispora thailandica]
MAHGYPYSDLPDFLRRLEKAGELKRVSVPVDPTLEISEITQRVVRAGGPALLFERPTRGDMPVLMNLFGTRRRTSLALGYATSTRSATGSPSWSGWSCRPAWAASGARWASSASSSRCRRST